MKHLVTAVFGLMLIASLAQAAEISAVGGQGERAYSDFDARTPVSITQNVDPTYIDLGASVACGSAGSHTTENWYLRRFFLGEDGITVSLSVASVDFGIDQCTAPFGVAIKLFTIAEGDAFLFANMTEIASADVAVDTSDEGTFINVPITGTIYAGDDMVVAVYAPDGEPTFTQFRPGVNASGASHDSYLAAEACGLTDPVGVTDIGFPDSQLILVVNGDADGTTATQELNFSSVKSLY